MSKGFLGRTALFGTAFIWGTSFVIFKTTLDSIGAMWVLAIRFTCATVLLGLFAGKKLKKMDRRCVRGSVMMGLCLAIAYIVQTYGLLYTTPGKNAFLTTTYCVLVPFLAWGIYKRRPDAANVTAAFLCITGIGLVSLSEAGTGINIGDALTLISGIFYALQIILMEQYVADSDALCVTIVQFGTAALLCWAGALLFEAAPAGVPGSAWFSIAYMSVMCTAVCYFLQAWGMQYTPSVTSAVILTFESVFGTLLSVLFYHEPMTVKLLLGFVLIFSAVLVSETKPKFFREQAFPRKIRSNKGMIR